MTKQELLELITNGENSYVEFKEEAIKAKELGEEFIAFANSEEGLNKPYYTIDHKYYIRVGTTKQ